MSYSGIGTLVTYEINKNSPEWLGVNQWANAELARIRQENETIGLDAVLTEANRHCIALLQSLLALPDAHKTLEFGPPKNTDYGIGIGIG